MTRHYIAMSGFVGCMPEYRSAHTTLDLAIGALAEVHDDDDEHINREELGRDRVISLNASGTMYAEITECDCSAPWEHSEDDGPENWDEEDDRSHVILDDLWLCVDCLMMVAYGHIDDASDDVVAACEAGIIELSKLGTIVSDDDSETGKGHDEFSRTPCDCCHSRFGGERFRHAVIK